MLGKQKIDINKMVYENIKIINSELENVEQSIDIKIKHLTLQANIASKLLTDSQYYFRTIQKNLASN